MADARGTVGDGPARRAAACDGDGRRVLRLAARSSPSTASSRPTSRSRDDDADRGRATTTRAPAAAARARATRVDAAAARGRRATRPSRRRATPRRRWSRSSRSAASAGPSTYASIIGTILDRGYVYKRGTALVPDVARVRRGPAARAALRRDWSTTTSPRDGGRSSTRSPAGSATATTELAEFYFGCRRRGRRASQAAGHRPRRDRRPRAGDASRIADERHRRCASAGTARTSSATATDGQRANVPDDLAARRADRRKAEELLASPAGDRLLGKDPATGPDDRGQERPLRPVRHRGAARGRAKKAKPRTASLFKTMSLDTVTLDDALKLLSLPRVVGGDPEDGEEITAQNGRYGPYLKKGTDSRSLDSEEQLLTITLDEALALYAQPKARGRPRAARRRCDELGDRPGRPASRWCVKEGRFGPYVTDGETTPPCARRRPARRSPSSGPPSCSPSGAPRAPRRRRSERPRRPRRADPRRRRPPRSSGSPPGPAARPATPVRLVGPDRDAHLLVGRRPRLRAGASRVPHRVAP